MSALAERLQQDMKDAMRAGDKQRLGVIRRARAAIKNAEIENRGPLDEAGVVRVLRVMARQHDESIEQVRAAGRDDRAAEEEAERRVIDAYLPALLDEAAIEAGLREVIAAEGASGPRDMGRVMKAAMARFGGDADGRTVSAIAGRLLSQGAT